MKKNHLILKMLRTFRDLGDDPMARIDARIWYSHFLKAAKKMKIVKQRRKAT